MPTGKGLPFAHIWELSGEEHPISCLQPYETLPVRCCSAAAGVDGLNTRSNNIAEVEQTLGIEAARTLIMDEVVG